MSILKSFFEIGCDKELFDGLEIAGDTELCEIYGEISGYCHQPERTF